MDIKELESKIRYYSEKYYAGEPEISDELFDNLVDQLRQLNPHSKVLTTGWGFEVKGNKVKHKYSHIGSLDKCKNYQEIPDRFKFKKIFISPKLDGLSAVAYYEEGVLVKGITRGNGIEGKDITDKLIKILGKEIEDKSFTGAVRGELIISKINWQNILTKNPDLIAPRNFAAGIINRKDIDPDIEYIDMVVYKIVGQENTPIKIDRNEILLWLSHNFKRCVPIYYYPQLNENSWNEYHLQTFEVFKEFGYELDGLVLTNEEVIYNYNTYGYMYDEAAFKFQADSQVTTIKEIEWTLSRTDRLVPVAIVEQVELSGALVNRCTCNNAKMVQDLGLGKGAEVEICRSGEVIPKIIGIVNPVNEELPDICPICKESLLWEGVDLKCNNPNCENKEASNLQQWCESIGETDGLQYTIMNQYLQQYGITTISKLYAKQNEVLNDLNSRVLSITEIKIRDFFNKLYIEPVDIEKALVALNIPRLGDKTAKLLSHQNILVTNLIINAVNKYNHFESSMIDVKDKLLALVKEATTESILNNYNKLYNLKYLYSPDFQSTRINFKAILNEKRYIAITGSLQNMKRKDFEKYIEQFGYELSSNLKKCEFLVNNDINSTSTKNKQAKEYGVKIITEAQCYELLNNK